MFGLGLWCLRTLAHSPGRRRAAGPHAAISGTRLLRPGQRKDGSGDEHREGVRGVCGGAVPPRGLDGACPEGRAHAGGAGPAVGPLLRGAGLLQPTALTSWGEKAQDPQGGPGSRRGQAQTWGGGRTRSPHLEVQREGQGLRRALCREPEQSPLLCGRTGTRVPGQPWGCWGCPSQAHGAPGGCTPPCRGSVSTLPGTGRAAVALCTRAPFLARPGDGVGPEDEPPPAPSSRGSSAEDFCYVFVVELERGPSGLGMGLIDGMVSGPRLSWSAPEESRGPGAWGGLPSAEPPRTRCFSPSTRRWARPGSTSRPCSRAVPRRRTAGCPWGTASWR